MPPVGVSCPPMRPEWLNINYIVTNRDDLEKQEKWRKISITPKY